MDILPSGTLPDRYQISLATGISYCDVRELDPSEQENELLRLANLAQTLKTNRRFARRYRAAAALVRQTLSRGDPA
jgi:hypothetical protein